MKELFKLVRFEHAIMLAIAVLTGEIVALGKIPDSSLYQLVLLSLAVPVFSEMGSFALNDYLDIESDRLNKRKDRPLLSGTISKEFTFHFSWVCFIISIVAAYFINTNAILVAMVFNTLAIAYNYKLKDLPLVGNLYIGLAMAIPFIFGNLVVSGQLSKITIILALLGFLSGLAREIIKSTEDLEGDIKARGSKTLPAIIGERTSILIAAVIYIIFIPLTILPFYYELIKANMFSLLLIVIADLLVLKIVQKIVTKMNQESYKFARKTSLLALFLGLVSYLLAVLL